MTTFQGFASLATPKDLLEKLRHDLKRLESAPADPYPAFDFFVTAEHLLDWFYPDSASPKNRTIREQFRKTEALLSVTSHLANGMKHFKTTAVQHQSVSDVHVKKGIFDDKLFDRRIFDTDRLLVELTGADAVALGAQLTALELARRVLKYWETWLHERS